MNFYATTGTRGEIKTKDEQCVACDFVTCLDQTG